MEFPSAFKRGTLLDNPSSPLQSVGSDKYSLQCGLRRLEAGGVCHLIDPGNLGLTCPSNPERMESAGCSLGLRLSRLAFSFDEPSRN